MARNVYGTDEYFMDKMDDILLKSFPGSYPKVMTRLASHVYIGNYKDAENIPALRRSGITHVLNCAAFRVQSHSPYPPGSGIVGYLEFQADDSPTYNMMQHFQQAKMFIDDAKYKGGKVLVHCAMGINRSGLICAAYLMLDKNATLLEVIKYLRHKRQIVLANRSFRKQLVVFARQKGMLGLSPISQLHNSIVQQQYSYLKGIHARRIP